MIAFLDLILQIADEVTDNNAVLIALIGSATTVVAGVLALLVTTINRGYLDRRLGSPQRQEENHSTLLGLQRAIISLQEELINLHQTQLDQHEFLVKLSERIDRYHGAEKN